MRPWANGTLVIKRVVILLFSHVQRFLTPWTATCQTSLSFIISRSLLKTHVHWVGDAIQPSPSLWSPSPALIFPSIRVFSNELVLHIRWPKYWSFSFSISPSNEYLGLISLKIDWFNLFAFPRDSQEPSSAPQFEGINSWVLCLLYGPTLTSIHDYWKDHSLHPYANGGKSNVVAMEVCVCKHISVAALSDGKLR